MDSLGKVKVSGDSSHVSERRTRENDGGCEININEEFSETDKDTNLIRQMEGGLSKLRQSLRSKVEGKSRDMQARQQGTIEDYQNAVKVHNRVYNSRMEKLGELNERAEKKKELGIPLTDDDRQHMYAHGMMTGDTSSMKQDINNRTRIIGDYIDFHTNGLSGKLTGAGDDRDHMNVRDMINRDLNSSEVQDKIEEHKEAIEKSREKPY
jgi:hypothetical protein